LPLRIILTGFEGGRTNPETTMRQFMWRNGSVEPQVTLRPRAAERKRWLLETHPAVADHEAVAFPAPQLKGQLGADFLCRSPTGGRLTAPLIRVVDVCFSLTLLAFLAPLMLAIAIAIFVFDPGPIIFAHRRVGRNGIPFQCYKFRSMYVGAEQRLEALLAADPERRNEWERDQKLADDPRITRVGGFLRVTSLDELPQLVNVLNGDMSLVGPRPIVHSEVPRYGRFIGAYYSVKPGLTGLWQVTGRSNTSYRRRVASDILYARSKSLSFDLRILAATVPAVIAGRGSM